jgi:hypothetical protein
MDAVMEPPIVRAARGHRGERGDQRERDGDDHGAAAMRHGLGEDRLHGSYDSSALRHMLAEMTGGAPRSKRKPAGPATPTPPPASQPSAGGTGDAPVADVRRWIYAGLDAAFAVVYAVAIWKVIPNRLPSAQAHLWTFPVASLAMAAGMLAGGRRGWWAAIAGGSFALLSLILLIIRIAISAAFLAGVYGAFGKAAATFALVMMALIVELVALLPIVQVKYLMTRAGRRAMGAARR